MTQPLDFQSIIMTLQKFWAERGCLIWQPYYSQVGAGTMNPATALRVLGPEPWNVGYVEPSIRPDDGRYGENPNRMQMHYQFQVILKPDPGNPQEIYLQSLQALGLNPRQHDFRFVEDNWESPALGAWGLGWEVWLDGQEITQFTYFQQSGGQLLDPVSVEMTYGLERIAIALQRVGSFKDIQWSPALTDGDVNLQAEQEHSKYYVEIADVERLRQMYDLYEQEAQACLDQKLVLPAHDYVLKCSHTFNVLDTRGAIGVTERQAYFGRMREFSRRVAEAYTEQRQWLEYPWLEEIGSITTGASLTTEASGQEKLVFTSPQSFLLEIGTEELPVGDVQSALVQLRERIPALLKELRLEHGEVRLSGTPRRLVASVEGLAPHQPDLEEQVKGPPAERAYDSLGVPTKAAEGFARSKGVAVSDLQVREMEGGKYVVAVVHRRGRPVTDLLSEALPNLLASLRFDKTMRWNSSNVYFSRPVRWILAMYGEARLPFEFAGVAAGKRTRGLRFQDAEGIEVATPTDYFASMAAQGILLDGEERQNTIQSQIKALAASVSGEVAPDADLLAEVTNLVEAPTALLGSFDPAYLELPPQVLISVMKKHQRYFPVEREGKLLPYFITVANKPRRAEGDCEGAETIIDGNQHVIRARFADAAFFVREDLKQPLEAYLPRLGTLIFQKKLGSMLDKSQRIRRLVDDLAPMAGLNQGELVTARRAAELCKADLATHMVVEMTSLQGSMGRYYAMQSGESPAVTQAIYEHYLPRFSGDSLPEQRPGLLVGLADRLDTLAGLFAAGLAPTGNKDPFAQRRAALGLVQSLVGWDLDFDLARALEKASAQLPIPTNSESWQACLDFIVERLRNQLLEDGWRYDIVDAVLAAQGNNPAGAVRAVKRLTQWVERPDWRDILPAYARCVRITRDLEVTYPTSSEHFVAGEEDELYVALQVAEGTPRLEGSVEDFLSAFLPLIPAINLFFDKVLVMDNDQTLQKNRLGLLQRIAALADGVAEMSRLEGF
ncbi:MAG: glycine--tRNA ligase subunit beta [Anaerolineales bacterium]|nr:MAG: glycine--tRNA ligase subunit beta [Anaerolineales bacterium]